MAASMLPPMLFLHKALTAEKVARALCIPLFGTSYYKVVLLLCPPYLLLILDVSPNASLLILFILGRTNKVSLSLFGGCATLQELPLPLDIWCGLLLTQQEIDHTKKIATI